MSKHSDEKRKSIQAKLKQLTSSTLVGTCHIKGSSINSNISRALSRDCGITVTIFASLPRSFLFGKDIKGSFQIE